MSEVVESNSREADAGHGRLPSRIEGKASHRPAVGAHEDQSVIGSGGEDLKVRINLTGSHAEVYATVRTPAAVLGGPTIRSAAFHLGGSLVDSYCSEFEVDVRAGES